MDMPLGVEKDIVRLDVSMDDILAVDIAQGTAQFGYPESDGFFGEGLSGDVKSQVATAHEIDHEIPCGYAVSIYRGFEQRRGLAGRSSHVFDILKAVAQVTDEGMVDMFEHSPLADNISNAFRFDDYSQGLLVSHAIPIPLPACVDSRDRQVIVPSSTVKRPAVVCLLRTFIFTDIFERKCQVGVFALDDADLAKGASADNS